ncbi:MAG: hypothetical protein CYPHOPRED_001457 [Cyphobasidiales sp. Tagirdzhanova-0007]|nr:MAG: hypothetical protein CYPHOPRED_001457 [Cyphobasidiales sp. Tagirdzhanova-0007]
MEGDAVSHRSRATGVSRKSSVTSRQSQLIKKNTGPMDLRPSDILIERFEAWKNVAKNLIDYFEGIADIEANTAKELTKLGGVIQVPFRAGNQFLGEGGIQDVFYNVREKTRTIADHHANLAKTVEGSIVQHLQKLRAEIKAHIKNIQMDTGKLAASVAREREMSTKVITDLARSITMLKNTPMGVTAREDPWYTNQLVATQLQKQVQEENALQKSIIIMQQNSAHFEEGVVRALQSAWETFDTWSGRMSTSVQQTWETMGTLMKSVSPDTEWIAFAARSDHLLDPETPLRNPDHINYPGKDDPSVIPVHTGLLERKKRFTSSYKEGYYVLTPSGYLHEHASSDSYSGNQSAPKLSVFLPNCTLGAPSGAHATSHKFHIEPTKKSVGGTAFTFRARSHEEMYEWWNDIKQLSKVYLTASEAMDRTGPVPAAVRSAGYLSEDEDEEEGGSSVEEEVTDDEEEEEEEENDEEVDNAPTTTSASVAHSTHTAETNRAPAYDGPATASGVEVGSSGYATEKKGDSFSGGASSAGETLRTTEGATMHPTGNTISENFTSEST